MCRKMPGIAIGRVCEKCEYPRPSTFPLQGKKKKKRKRTEKKKCPFPEQPTFALVAPLLSIHPRSAPAPHVPVGWVGFYPSADEVRPHDVSDSRPSLPPDPYLFFLIS